MREYSIAPAKQNAVCRWCDRDILKGEIKMSFYSHRNKGMHIHLHPECVSIMNSLCNEQYSCSPMIPEEECDHSYAREGWKCPECGKGC